jgi:hypothetical protein
LRNQSNRAGVNRVNWDLRIDGPQITPASAPGGPGAPPGSGGRGAGGGDRGAGGAGGGGGGRGSGGAPQVVPGDYVVTLQIGSKQMSKPVRVVLDPKVKVSQADLQAQFNAAKEVQALGLLVNDLVNRVEDQIRQVTPASDSARRPALDRLNQLHAKLVRECSMSYRCGAKLRENVNSLLSSVTGTIARPSDGMLLLAREYKEEAAQAAAELNTILSTATKK